MCVGIRACDGCLYTRGYICVCKVSARARERRQRPTSTDRLGRRRESRSSSGEPEWKVFARAFDITYSLRALHFNLLLYYFTRALFLVGLSLAFFFLVLSLSFCVNVSEQMGCISGYVCICTWRDARFFSCPVIFRSSLLRDENAIARFARDIYNGYAEWDKFIGLRECIVSFSLSPFRSLSLR